MATTISGTSGVTYPSGGVDNTSSAGVGINDTQTLTNKTLTSPNIGGTPVMNASVITSGTAVATTSGTSVDYTSIPSWVKRITVMLNNVSTSGTSPVILRIGSGSIQATGYGSGSETGNGGFATAVSTTYFYATASNTAASQSTGHAILTNVSGNIWVQSGLVIDSQNGTSAGSLIYNFYTGVVTLSGVLDRLRLTTVNGTDTFDAGSVNILYE